MQRRMSSRSSIGSALASPGGNAAMPIDAAERFREPRAVEQVDLIVCNTCALERLNSTLAVRRVVDNGEDVVQGIEVAE
jgi:hypothetical protein